MSKRKVLAVGNHVFAKWPGSSKYYKGVVVKYDDEQDAYDVKFDDVDDTLLLPAKNVYAEKRFLLRGRSASPSRVTPTSRGREESRSKSSSGSPRKPRSPGRKSIGAVVQVQSDQSFGKVTDEKVAMLDEAIATIIEARSSLQTSISEVEDVKLIGKNLSELSSRYISKSKSASETQTVTENTVVNRRMTQAHNKSLPKDAKQVKEGKQEQIKQYCSSIGSGLGCILQCGLELVTTVVILPILVSLVYGLHFACQSTSHCTFLELPQIPSQAIFYSWLSTSYVFGWYLLQAVLFMLPVGKIIQGPLLKDKSRHCHRLNGNIQLVCSFLLTGILVYSGHFPSKHITGFYTSMITATILFGLLMSILVFIQQRVSLPASSSGTVLSDFVHGRSVYPILLKEFNVKAYGFRTGMISWGVLVLIHFVEHCSMLRNGEWPNVALLLHVLMNILYVSYHFIFEESAYYTATFTNEKVGAFMIVSLLTFFPFFYSFATKYLTIFHPTYPHVVCYAFPVIVFVIGFYIYHSATSEKLRFRKQPPATVCPGVDCILTQDGKNILVGGWWGRLRHPNYFADLLMAYSLAGICGFAHLLPWVYPLLLTVLLVLMARQDDFLCKEKYGQSWVEYQRRVKYKFLPFVY